MARPQPTDWFEFANIMNTYDVNQEVPVSELMAKIPGLKEDQMEKYARDCINFGYAKIDRVKSNRSLLVSYIMRKKPTVPVKEETKATETARAAAPTEPKKRGRPTNAERIAAGKIPDTGAVIKNALQSGGPLKTPTAEEAKSALKEAMPEAPTGREAAVTAQVVEKLIHGVIAASRDKSGPAGYRSAASRMNAALIGNAA